MIGREARETQGEGNQSRIAPVLDLFTSSKPFRQVVSVNIYKHKTPEYTQKDKRGSFP